MSTDDDEFERMRVEADLDAQLDPRLAEPLPAGWDGDRDIDLEKVRQLIFAQAPPEGKAAILAGELRLALSGFDGDGRAKVHVIDAATGEVVGGVLTHWSAIAKR